MNTHWNKPRNPADMFWGELSPVEHFVQIYTNDSAFLDSLASYVANGFKAGDGVIVITTLAHRVGLEDRLMQMDFDLRSRRLTDQYIPVDASETLSRFMINGWPDENLFQKNVDALIHRARKRKRNVRAFGEMVALLWSDGNPGAAVRLEHLWNILGKQEDFRLYCAYPKICFTQDPNNSIEEICSLHSRVFPG